MIPGTHWAVRMSQSQADFHLPRLRNLAHLTMCNEEAYVWILWEDLSTGADVVRREWKGLDLYVVDAEKRLIPLDAKVPTRRLPEGPWTAMPDSVALADLYTLPAPRNAPPSCSIRLIRSSIERPAMLLCCDIPCWSAWVNQIATPVLAPLQVCFPDTGRVWVRGSKTLPPIQGERYTVQASVALPLGFVVDPPVPHSLLRRSCGTQTNDLLVFHRAGHVEEIPEEAWLTASRRTTRFVEELRHG